MLSGLCANAVMGSSIPWLANNWVEAILSRERLMAALEAGRRADGRLALEFEIVYGHAFCAPPRVPVAPETTVGVEQLRSMARSGRASG